MLSRIKSWLKTRAELQNELEKSKSTIESTDIILDGYRKSFASLKQENLTLNEQNARLRAKTQSATEEVHKQLTDLRRKYKETYKYRDAVAIDFSLANAISIERVFHKPVDGFVTLVTLLDCDRRFAQMYFNVSEAKHRELVTQFNAAKHKKGVVV